MSSKKTFCIFSMMVTLAAFFMVVPVEFTTYAQAQQPKAQGNVLNRYGAPVGAVDENGIVTTPYGSKLGSVDAEGNVYNVSSMLIGKVDGNGDIFNQAGHYFGYVDKEGDVYNVSEFKLGSVQTGGNVFLAGGAARIIFFKASKGAAKKPGIRPR